MCNREKDPTRRKKEYRDNVIQPQEFKSKKIARKLNNRKKHNEK